MVFDSNGVITLSDTISQPPPNQLIFPLGFNSSCIYKGHNIVDYNCYDYSCIIDMPYAEPSNFQFVLLTVCPDSHRAIMSDPEGPNTTPIEALNAQHFYDSCLSLSLDRFPFELGQKEAEDRESLRTDVIEAGVGTLLSAVLGGLLGGAAGGPPGAATGAILAGGSAAQISIFIVGFRHAWDSLQTYRWTLQHGCALFDQERECYEQTQEVGVFDPTDAAEVVRAPDDILDRFNSLGISSFVIQATCPAG